MNRAHIASLAREGGALVNRRERRAQARALRRRGTGWTKPIKPESRAQQAAVEVGLRRMAHVVANLDRLPLKMKVRS